MNHPGLRIPTIAGALGDWLSITPLLDARPGSTVIAKDSPHTRLFATVFEGMAEVEFVPPTTVLARTTESLEPVCYSQRILNAYGVTGRSAIPIIRLTDAEKDWARDHLKDYANPIVFNPTTASCRPDIPAWDLRNYRKLPRALALELIDTLHQLGHTVLRFGCRNTQTHIYANYEPYDGVVDMCDLTIRQAAACYHVIGQYVGTDSADHHLMLSVGGSCHCFVPPSCPTYDHRLVLYNDSAWAGRSRREQYTTFTPSLA